ncbi:MAG TPA: Hsp20/alpha crystallin family protein [Thermoprotei archaeon]|nr:Hsp20/alpha crystallin family protein [Thermoprotei archaeon]
MSEIDEFFEKFFRLRRKINEIFEDLETLIWFEKPMHDVLERCLEPLTEIIETEREIIIRMDLPYVRNKENIDINIVNDVLTVTAEMEREIDMSKTLSLCKGLYFNRFKKTIRLPPDIDPSKIKARFRNGILEIIIPKKVRRYRIRIE